LPEKKIGGKTDCGTCGGHLICRMSDYGGKWEDKPQWQDEDGNKAHFDKFGNCKHKPVEENIPNEIKLKDNKNQTILQESTTAATLTAGDPPRLLNNLTNDEMITRTYDMVKQMYRDYVDTKITEVKLD